MVTLIVVIVWLVVSVGAGLIVGRGISLADRREHPRQSLHP